MSEITPNTPNPVREDAYKQQLAAKLGIDPQYIPGSPIWHSEEEIAAIAEMFSNMAGGSSGGGMFVVTVGEGNVCDKSYNDIISAIQSNLVVALKEPDGGGYENMLSYLSSTQAGEGGYFAYFAGGSVGITASSADANMTYLE